MINKKIDTTNAHKVVTNDTSAEKYSLQVEQDLSPKKSGIGDAVTSDAILWALNKFVIVSISDTEGNITYANDKFVEISKYTREELIGQNHRILKSGYHPKEFYDDMWRNYLSKGKVWTGDIKNQAKDGSLYWVHATIAPIFGTEKKITGYIGIRFLITERRDAEDKLALTSDILRQTQQPWVMTDLSGKFVDANDSACAMYGYTLDELMKLNYGSLIVASEVENSKKAIESVLSTNKFYDGETISVRKDGSHFEMAYTINVYLVNKKPVYLYGFLTDISDRKSHDRELEKSIELMVGRELKMIELKQQIAELKKQIEDQAVNDA